MKIKYNEVNIITGIYVKSILSQKPSDNHLGHYKIHINDTLEIILLPPYYPEAIRPNDEVQMMEGKMVKVVGIVVEKTYLEQPSIENAPLCVFVPCFTEIESITLIK